MSGRKKRRERKKNVRKAIWKSNSNNKSLQVNEVECVFDWLNYAHRDRNVNTCSFFPNAFFSNCVFFLSLLNLCAMDVVLILVTTAIIIQLETISQTQKYGTKKKGKNVQISDVGVRR